MNRPARFASPSPSAGLSAGEFQRMVDSGAFADLRVELVAGEIVKMMPSYLAYDEPNRRLGAKLLALFGTDARVAVDLMVATSANTVRAADIAVVRSTTAPDRPVDPADVPLVVEIAGATLGDDPGAKMDDYAVAGIEYYCMVDPDRQVVHAMAGPRDGGYAARRAIRFGEPMAVPGTDASIVVD